MRHLDSQQCKQINFARTMEIKFNLKFILGMVHIRHQSKNNSVETKLEIS